LPKPAMLSTLRIYGKRTLQFVTMTFLPPNHISLIEPQALKDMCGFQPEIKMLKDDFGLLYI
jgi:hypothetical protein